MANNYLKIDCPTCGALAGRHCFTPNYRIVCSARLAAVPVSSKKRNPDTIARMYYTKGRYPSAHCNTSRHIDCRKECSKGNETYTGCTCTCHKLAAKQAEWETKYLTTNELPNAE